MTQNTPSINELKSYTEYNVSAPTSVFTIGFQYIHNVDEVNVYVDGVEATAAGYTIQHDSHGTITLTPAVPSGVVRLSRETDIDTSEHTFSAGAKFTAGNMDENFKQIRHSQQEVRDGFSKLSDDTYAIIDTLQDVGQAAQDAADAAEQAAITANDAAAQVNDKVSYQDLPNAIAATPHNNLADRNVVGAHSASAIGYGDGSVGDFLDDQKELNDISVHTVLSLPTANLKNLNGALLKDSGLFYYDESKALENNFGTVINGWVRITDAVLTPKMFGAKGDGVTNDKLAIQRMFAMTSAGFRTFDFEGLLYYCGNVEESADAFFEFEAINSLRISGVNCKVDNSIVAVSDVDRPLFKFIDCSDLYAEVNLVGEQSANREDYTYGLQAVVIEAKTIDSENVRVVASCVYSKSAFETRNAIGLTATRPVGYPIVRGINAIVTARDSIYAHRSVNCGENINLEINSVRVGRSFFTVGTTNVTAVVNSKEQTNIADVVVKAYRNNVSNIKVILNTDAQLDNSENIVVIEHQNDQQDTRIENVDIDVRVSNRGAPKSWSKAFVVVGRQYPAATSVIQAATNSITDNIKISINYEEATTWETVEFPTKTNVPCLVELSGASYTRETNNFTVKIGNRYICSTAKNPKDNNLYIYLKNLRPSGIIGKLSILGVDDYRQLDMINFDFKQVLVKFNYAPSSPGTLTEIGTPVTSVDGTPWGYSALPRLGCIQVATNRDLTSAYTKFVAVFEPVVGTHFL